jgi:Na+-driven multidrug efflux pump
MTAYRKFALPCLGLWVSGPLLSLVDTAFVGLSGASSKSAEQLAALGPATTFFDGATYLFAFLNVATTNLYASARAQAGEDSDRAESVVRTASRVSLYCGLGLTAFLFAFARPLLALYIGPKAAATPGLIDDAVAYVKIRALSMPTTLVLGVLQAALLGAKDSVTPLIAILYSTIVNVIGDFILVNRLKWGLQGASIATTLAQWVATIALMGPARRELVKNGNLEIVRKKTIVPDGVSGRAFLGFAAPVLTLILGKIAAFGFMTHVAAALPGQPVTLAAHQIILSLFFFVSPFLEVISQTAQTFLPTFFAPVKDYVVSRMKEDASYNVQNDAKAQEWFTAATTVGTRLLGLGMAVACVVATLASLIPAFFGGALSSDVAVQEAVKPLAPYLFAGCFLTAPVAVSEGILLARRELKFLASVYIVSTTLLPPALLRIKKLQEPVSYVWGAFAVFQLFRASCFTLRIWGNGVVKKLIGASGNEAPTE